MKYKRIIITVILIGSLVSVAIFQEKYPIPALLGITKIEAKLTNVVKISNSPVKYIVKQGSYGELDDGIKIVQAEGGSEWMQDFIIGGNRYPADWVIYLGRYRIYTLKTTSRNAPLK